MKVCTRCVMEDSSDKDISFNKEGVCNYCLEFELKEKKFRFSENQVQENLLNLRDEVRLRSSKSKSEYDVLLGLSGGVDSSYVCHLTHEMGLKALCLHFDNGWNSDISVTNIRNLVNKCGFELLNVVMDWFEFKDIQRAFFKSGVIDIELITDNSIYALAFQEAKERKIRSWFTGSNYLTEHGMPPEWSWFKQDHKNIKDIYKKFGEPKKISKLPLYGPHKYAFMRAFNLGGVKQFKVLDLVNFNLKKAKELLMNMYDWRSYGNKHEESIFTSFYQNYVLPKKFGVDKRRVHLSALIRNGEVDREDALEEININPLSKNTLARNKGFVLKKLNFTEEEFDELMDLDPIPHKNYKNLSLTNKFYSSVYKLTTK